MASYNQSNMNFQAAGGAGAENKSMFNRVLRQLSNWGMSYDDMVYKNRVAVGANEDPQAARNEGMYDFFSSRAISSLMNQKAIPYLDKAYPDKRRILREYSIKDEIRDFVTTIADEVIVFDDDKNWCKPKNLPADYPEDVKNKYIEAFERIYSKFNFNDGITAWNYFKQYLIDGFISFEIVYDDKQQEIIGFELLDSATIIPGIEPTTGAHIWIQFPEDPLLRRILLDVQVIHLSYTTGSDFGETSYVEGLIRPYNQLKLIEQTKLMFNMANATHYQKFNIPIQGLSRQRAEEQIGQLIADYSEEVQWDDTMGTVSINGMKHLPYNKQLWFPEGESGTPTMEIVTPEGHNLNEDTMLDWFFKALKRATRIPFGRFDADQGGGNMYGDATEMTRDEIKFSNFIERLRASFKEIMIKPLRLQMLIEFPELREDDRFFNDIMVEFNKNDLFEEWKYLNNMSKRAGIVGELLGSIQNADGTPYFHVDFLIDKIMKLTDEEKQENESYWAKNPAGGGEGGEGGAGGDEFGGGGDFGGGDFGGGDEGGDFGGGDEGGDFGGEEAGGDEGGGDEFDF
jgi:hypothetical protein